MTVVVPDVVALGCCCCCSCSADQQLAKCGTQKVFCLVGHIVIKFVGYWKLRQNSSWLKTQLGTFN